jgi:hypothetical protein
MSAPGHYIHGKLTSGAEVGLKHAVNGNDFHTIPAGAAQTGAIVENGAWFVVLNSNGDYYKTNDGKTWAGDNSIVGKYDHLFVRTAKFPADHKWLVHGKLKSGAHVGLTRTVSGNDFATEPAGAAIAGAIVEHGAWFVVKNSLNDYYKTNDGKTWAKDDAVAGVYDHHFAHTPKWPAYAGFFWYGKLKGGAGVGIKRDVSGNDFHTIPAGAAITGAQVENGTWFVVKNSLGDYYKTNDGKAWAKDNSIAGKYDRFFVHTDKYPGNAHWIHGYLTNGAEVGLRQAVSGNDYHTLPVGSAVTGAIVENGTWFVVKNSLGHYYKTNDGKTWAQDQSLAGKYEHLFVRTHKFQEGLVWVAGRLKAGAEVAVTKNPSGNDYHTVPAGAALTGAVVENGTWFVVKNSLGDYYKTNDGKAWAKDNSIAGKYDGQFPQTDKSHGYHTAH